MTSTPIWPALAEQLRFQTAPFPADAIQAIAAHKEAVIPELIQILQDTARDPSAASDGNYMLHLYAMHLLAAWRVTDAYAAMVAIGGFGDEQLEMIMGDVITETYGRCLASVCDGNTAPLQAMFENQAISVWSRTAALIAWQVRVISGDNDRAPLLQFLQEQGEKLANQRRHESEGDAILLETIVDVATALCANEMLGQINSWFDENLLDPQLSDRDWLNEHIHADFQASRLLELQHGKSYISDVEKEMGWWPVFQEPEKQTFRKTYTQHTIRKEAKIGRNDPCPCGSGKKYKKCHGSDV